MILIKMNTNQYTPQYSQYIKKYQQLCPSNNYQMYNYNNQPAYSTPQPTRTAATFIRPTVPVQQQQASTPKKKLSSIWMGRVQPYMTEGFITGAFKKMGEYPMNVKLKLNKDTAEISGYAFIDFYDSVSVMHKLNGKFIPGTIPPVKFKLNHAGSLGKNTSNERVFSVWIGELNPCVDDYQLYKMFACRYPSIHTAKVVLDSAGFSKGYGFINFGSEEEQKHCLNNMNGFLGLSSKPIKVRRARPQSKSHVASNDSQGYKASQDYGQYFETDYCHHASRSGSIWKETSKSEMNCNLWDALESSIWRPLNAIEYI